MLSVSLNKIVPSSSSFTRRMTNIKLTLPGYVDIRFDVVRFLAWYYGFKKKKKNKD